jgi:hypothetical protein
MITIYQFGQLITEGKGEIVKHVHGYQHTFLHIKWEDGVAYQISGYGISIIESE